MENLTLERSQSRYYQPINYNPNNNLLFLYEFFRDIFFDEIEKYTEIFSDPDFEYTQTDFAFIEREEDTMIIGSHLVINYEDQYKNTLRCTPIQLINALKQWEHALTKKPNQIMIQQDDYGDFHIFSLPEKPEIN